MKTLRIAQAAMATILVVGISSNSFAFMAAGQSAPADLDLNQMVDAFRNEIALGETECEEMLAKLNSALEEIDARLDAGVDNETEHLAARDAIVEMRRGLDCLATQLVQIGGLSGSGSGTGGFGGLGSGGVESGAGGSNTTGGSLVGGSTTGTGGFGGLISLGGFSGVVAGATGNRSTQFPGFIASPSGSN